MQAGVPGTEFEFSQTTRYVPNAFAGGVAQIPNNPLIAAAFTAIFKGGPKARALINGWEIDQDGIIKYRHIGRRGGEIAIYFDVGKESAANRGALVAKQIALRVNKGWTDPNLDRHFAFLAATLTKSKYFAGDELTACDVNMSYAMEAIATRFPNMPAVFGDYVKRIRERPAFKRAEERGGSFSVVG